MYSFTPSSIVLICATLTSIAVDMIGSTVAIMLLYLQLFEI